MNIAGIGTDIVEIARIKAALDKHGQRFAKRILHDNELAIYQHHQQPASYLAKRFAAKEAVAKALGTGIGKYVSFSEIETLNDTQGKPSVHYHGETKAYVHHQCISNSFLSLSDERDYAIAYVVLVNGQRNSQGD